ncbi:MAG: hypothetical protein ACI81S_001079 [Sphingobacteriales bacterium]
MRLVGGIILKSSFVPKGRCGLVAKATLKMKSGLGKDNDFRIKIKLKSTI